MEWGIKRKAHRFSTCTSIYGKKKEKGLKKVGKFFFLEKMTLKKRERVLQATTSATGLFGFAGYFSGEKGI